MTALSKAFVTIADAAVDPDSPIDATLMTGFRDNDIHNREWIGASFFAGAVQDHNHDGANSALVPVGPNLLRNGSFEDGEGGWTFTDFTGGSHAISTSNHRHGAKSATITSTVLANGGGDAITNEYITVGEADAIALKFWIWASAANVSSKLEVNWYDNAKSSISTSLIQSYTDTPTTPTLHRASVTAPSNARYFRVKITGGVPAAGSATGTITFEGIHVSDTGGVLASASGSGGATLDIVLTAFSAYRHKMLIFSAIPATDAVDLRLRVSTDGGSSYEAGASVYAWNAGGMAGGSGFSEGNTGDSSIRLEVNAAAAHPIGNAAAEGCNFKIMMWDTTNTARWPSFTWEGMHTSSNASPRVVSTQGGAHLGIAQDTDAIRLFFSTGNLGAFSWTLYGFN